MTEQVRTYGTVLYELGLSQEDAKKVQKLFADCPQLLRCLTSPAVSAKKKHEIVGKVFCEPEFPQLMTSFLKKLCDADCVGELDGICEVQSQLCQKAAGILPAELEYVTEPDKEQLAGIRAFLCGRYGAKDVALTMSRRPELVGGFVLRTGDQEYDYSLRGQLGRLREAVER